MTDLAPPRTLIGEVEIYATISMKKSTSSTLTRYPVEVGAKRSDHATENPLRISLDCILTDTPLVTQDRTDRGMGTQVNLTPGFEMDSKAGYALIEYARLEKYRTDREAVTVRAFTGEEFKDMVLVALDLTHDAKTGGVLRFSVGLEQIIFAETKRVSVDFSKMKSAKKPAEKEQQGKKTAEAAKVSESVAFKIFGD